MLVLFNNERFTLNICIIYIFLFLIDVFPAPILQRSGSISNMISRGYTKVYDTLYSSLTTLSDLNSILSSCSVNSILCAGGAAVGSDTFLLVSCGDCRTVLKPTPQNAPVYNNGAYWYLTNSLSFGFSDIYTISQGNCDNYDYTDNLKLSWNMGCAVGCTYRLGILYNDGSTNSQLFYNNYRKIILII